MKNRFSKIIVSLLLSVSLWSILGFSNEALAYCDTERNNYQNPADGASAAELAADKKAYLDCVQQYETAAKATAAANDSSTSGGINWGSVFGSLFKGLDVAGGIVNGPAFLLWAGFLYLVTLVMSLLVYISAGLFDGFMYLTISKFSDVASVSGIEVGWTIIRDFINISFIFILLYISISIILGDFGPKKKSAVASVIIAALLINFSLFFTRIFIDFGNILAVALANHTSGGIGAFSKLIMDGIKAPGIFKLSNLSITGQAGTVLLMVMQISILGIIIWAFLKAAFLFIGRMVSLIVLMTLSPIGFVGGAIPWLKEKSDEWKESLIGQVSVAPIFLFFLVLISKLTENASTIKDLTERGLGGGVWGTNFPLGPIIYLALIIAMLIGGVKMTEKTSGKVGEIGGKITKALASAIAIMVTGGIAIASGGMALGAEGAAMAGASRIARFGAATKKLATGELGNETGATGFAARMARGNFMGTFKDVTGGKVDLKKWEGDYKKYQKESEERAMKKMEAVGPQKAYEERKRLEDTQKNIDEQATRKDAKLKSDLDRSEEKVNDLEKDLKEAEREMENTKNGAEAENNRKKRASIEEKIREARAEKQNLSDKFKVIQDEVAKSIGLSSVDDITSSMKEADKKITEGIQNKNKFIADFEKSGVIKTGFFGENRKKIANKMRAQQGKYKGDNDLREAVKKLIKDQNLSEESAGKTGGNKGGEGGNAGGGTGDKTNDGGGTK